MHSCMHAGTLKYLDLISKTFRDSVDSDQGLKTPSHFGCNRSKIKPTFNFPTNVFFLLGFTLLSRSETIAFHLI